MDISLKQYINCYLNVFTSSYLKLIISLVHHVNASTGNSTFIIISLCLWMSDFDIYMLCSDAGNTGTCSRYCF
jgi:hypothetical protein